MSTQPHDPTSAQETNAQDINAREIGAAQAAAGIADPALLAQAARTQQRTYSLYYVVMGLAMFVAAILLDACGLVLGLLATAVVLGVCGRAWGGFTARHQHLAQRFANLSRTFWIVLGAGLLVSLVGTFWRHDGDPAHQWIIWLGGMVGLVAGLAAGHLVSHAEVSSPEAGATH